MKRLCLAVLFVGLPMVPSLKAPLPSTDRAAAGADRWAGWRTLAAPGLRWGYPRAFAQDADPSAKEAFEAAKELGTTQAWSAFLARYPSGFYADLARAYLQKLGAPQLGLTPDPAAGQANDNPPAQTAAPAPPAPAPVAAAPAAAAGPSGPLAPTDPGQPAIARGAPYMGFPEQFNRYYTDPAWKPARIVYVSPNGRGGGATRATPASVQTAIGGLQPGTLIFFLAGAYQGCFELTKEQSGTYDAPVVLYGERNADRSLGVSMRCCSSGRKTCFNLEGADYVAVDGFELIGGRYGVRVVGLDFTASQHSRGAAVLDCNGHDQDNDPFFSGQADWAVWERNVGAGAKAGDGHGIYLSNGSDWNIVRFNETHGGVSSDFQINADPNSTCKEAGIAFSDPACDAYAGTGEGGRGASDYFLVDGNFFHHSLGPGANFTSVRRSVVRNNIFGLAARHNVSFWQETDNPKLGSSDNVVAHNLFITTARHGVQFVVNSTRNQFINNLLLGVRINGGSVSANPSALLMEVDDTVGENVYRGNLYVSGKIEGREPGDDEKVLTDFAARWFKAFPAALNHDPNAFAPAPGAPFLGLVAPVADAAADRNGTPRASAAEPGPIELP